MKNVKTQITRGRRGYVSVKYTSSDPKHHTVLSIGGALSTLLANLWILVRATISAGDQGQHHEPDKLLLKQLEQTSFLCACGHVASHSEAYCPICGNSLSTYDYWSSK